MLSFENALYTEVITICCTYKTDAFRASLCLIKSVKAFTATASFLRDWLHPKELVNLYTLQYPRRQESYALGRLAAKKALHAYFPKLEVASIIIERGVFDQPILLGENLSGTQVSIAHKENYAASLICSERHPMAVDIEKIRPDQYSAVFSILTNNEVERFLSAQNFNFKGDIYSLIWSVKESLGKVLKTGLLASMEIFEISQIEEVNHNLFVSTYTHFPLYKTLSFIWQGMTISITLPKLSLVQGDIS